ncbi:hypothetical protein HNR19_000946 [Nocardioides thalensis]|uniref:Secreted protein n=1 Tax=Nocardioides thalensis TaxID=1914755 RepID=A0A853C0V9_9ACTN|nr:hypothetical protein [Nocardioides thalensis]NYJ00248.1 hypothetical protein [Nocardioides thalensis]
MGTISRKAAGLATAVVAVTALCLAARPATVEAAETETSAEVAATGYGNWPLHANCPVDHPAILASPPGNYTACVQFSYGSQLDQLKIGNLKLRGGGSIRSEFGVFGPSPDNNTAVPSATPISTDMWITGTESLVSPFLLQSLCGLLGGSGPFPVRDGLYGLCLDIADQVGLDKVLSVRVEPAGTPSQFRLSGVINGGPALNLPIKLRLVSPALGPNCYIGSNARPVMLRLNASGPATYHQAIPDDNGFAVTGDIYGFGADFLDTSFAVPAASGCGNPVMDLVLNRVLGLPSASGRNSASVARLVSVQSTTAGGTELFESLEAARSDPWWPWQ